MNDDELAGYLTGKPATDTSRPVVAIESGSVDGIFDPLLLYFESHPEEHDVQIVRDDLVVGYLDRDTLYRIVPPLSRGIGDADHYSLLGDTDDELLTFVCPVEGCDYQLSVVLMPAGRALKCQRHPGSVLRKLA
jgi:hypothetical protein